MIEFVTWVRRSVATRRTRPPGAPETCCDAPGDEATDAAPSDDSEGEDRERWILPCESVNGCLHLGYCFFKRIVPLPGNSLTYVPDSRLSFFGSIKRFRTTLPQRPPR